MPPRNPMPSVKCKAKTRAGHRCGYWAMQGQKVCRRHGASAPQNLEAARRRLDSYVEPALKAYRELLGPNTAETVRFAVARDVLDRTGLKPALQTQIDQQITIQVLREDQPIIIEKAYRALSNGHDPDDQTR